MRTSSWRNLATANPQAGDGKHAVVINEYGWLWLNRDGTPTTLTRQLYENLLGTRSTTAQRFTCKPRISPPRRNSGVRIARRLP